MRMRQIDAEAILHDCEIVGGSDFHALTSSQVERLLAEADKRKYRKPKNANGSRGRYFYALVDRVAHS